MTRRPTRLLILGGSSYVGQHLRRRLVGRDATATFRHAPFPDGVRFDSLTMRIEDAVPDPKTYSHAVLLLADSQPDNCFADPAGSHATNVVAMKALIGNLLEHGITPIFASTEFVFDGTRGDYREDDVAAPILLYGRQKLEVERHLAGLGAPYAVLRFAKVVGDESDDGALFSGWVRALRAGVRVQRCAADQAFSPVFVGDVADAIVAVTDRGLTGLYHLSGNRRYRRIELLKMFLDAVRRHGARDVFAVEPCSIRDFPLPEPRPIDVSMRCDRLIADADFRPTDIEAICNRVAASALA